MQPSPTDPDVEKDDRVQVRRRAPLNLDTPPELLRGHYVTPTPLFFVRNHGELPRIDPAHHLVQVQGDVRYPLDLSLDDLRQNFPFRQVTATLQCVREPAVGTAVWGGTPLAMVLEMADPVIEAGHVVLVGADLAEGERFAVSIPLAKALSEEVLLAWEMNQEPLHPEHGAPLRVVVPGHVGVRSVKWLTEIRVQPEAWQSRLEHDLLAPGEPTGELPVDAAICTPADGAPLTVGSTLIGGYATSGHAPIDRVEVSVDGEVWHEAELEVQPSPRWSWQMWHLRLTLPAGEHHLVVRARDAEGRAGEGAPVRVRVG